MTRRLKPRLWFDNEIVPLRPSQKRRRASVRLLLEQLEKRELPAVFLVTTALDNGDNVNPLASSLRAAILDANASANVGGPDQIQFSLSGTGPFTITPLTSLPTITDPVVIDGTTQPGYAGTPLIVLSGRSGYEQPRPIGLDITAGGSTVTGLVINRFAVAGIELEGANGGNAVTGNLIGTDGAVIVSLANLPC